MTSPCDKVKVKSMSSQGHVKSRSSQSRSSQSINLTRIGGGGGSYTSDTMASSRSGLFCAAFDCSNNNSVQKARDFFRFQKEHNLLLFIKKINDLVGTRPI